jgi:UDP-N-acetyl-D-mannosaminuronic acid dehydrogenase
LLSERIGVNAWEVIRLANHHPRVNILQPGPGVGGHCIAVDPWFLVDAAPDLAMLLTAARKRNDAMPEETANRILATARARSARTIALLGMAYKGDIDDCRESPSVQVLQHLQKQAPELEFMVCEPNVRQLADIPLASLDECVKMADILAILVTHREFRQFDWAALPPSKTVLDFKGVLKASHSN